MTLNTHLNKVQQLEMYRRMQRIRHFEVYPVSTSWTKLAIWLREGFGSSFVTLMIRFVSGKHA